MISVVIPALNEEDAIALTIEKIRKGLAGVEGYEIVIVDDGSTDGTGRIARENGAIVVRHPHNMGYGRSLKDGIAISAHDTIVILDADGTYRADEMPILLEEYKKGFDLVVGQRTGKHYRESWFKAPLRGVLKMLVEFTVGRRVMDINSGFRVFSKKDVMPYFKHLCNTFSFTTSMTMAYMLDGKFVSHVKISYDKRIGKSKVRLFKDSLGTLQYIIEAVLHFNPLKMYLILCLPPAFISLVFFAIFIFTMNTLCVLSSVISLMVTIIVFAIGLHAVLEQKK